MTEWIRGHERSQRKRRSAITLAAGLVTVGLILLASCKTAPTAGAVVKGGNGMEFAFVPSGNFKMGSDKPGEDRSIR